MFVYMAHEDKITHASFVCGYVSINKHTFEFEVRIHQLDERTLDRYPKGNDLGRINPWTRTAATGAN